MIFIIYLFTGIVFGLGLSISGMSDPSKVKAFLVPGFADWNPALLFVLGSAVPVYFVFFKWMQKRAKSFNGSKFSNPPPRPIDRKLLLGSLIFGIGWGILGICPGPAITHIAYLDREFFVFILAMFAGFSLNKRLA